MSPLQSAPSRNSTCSISNRSASSPRFDRVVLVGDQDASTAPALRSRLDELIDHSEADIVLDLTNVTFIDSATAQVLLGVRDRLDRQGNQLKLLAPSPSTGRFLKLCGMSRLISQEVTFPRGGVGVRHLRVYTKAPKSGENTQ